MTSGKSNKSRKQKTATDDTKNKCTDKVQDEKDDTKNTSIEHVRDAKDDKKEDEKVNDPDKPICPSATNGAYSQHFDPISAENNNNNITRLDISK